VNINLQTWQQFEKSCCQILRAPTEPKTKRGIESWGSSWQIEQKVFVYVETVYSTIWNVRLLRNLPEVPRKAVAEISMIGKYSRRGELLWCMDGKANPLMDRKVGGVCWSCVFWSGYCYNGCSGHLTHNCWM
jgi:hypothetical protein